MNPEFVNMYIERLIKEVEDAARTRILIDTQLKYTEHLNVELNKKIEELESKVSQLESQIEKQSKRNSKKSDPDPEIF